MGIMRFIKHIILFSCFLPALVFSAESADLCASSFSNPREFIKVFFADSKNFNQYKGQQGFIEFAEEHLSSFKIDAVFNYVSSVLPIDKIKNLNWPDHIENIQEIMKKRLNILDKNYAKEEYRDLEGYINYADEHHKGDMQEAYENILAIVPKYIMKILNWQIYSGTTNKLMKEISRILDEDGKVKEEHRGLRGFVRYADKHYKGDLQEAYKNIAAIVPKHKMKQLGWEAYIEKIKEIQEERSKFLDEGGNIKEEFQNIESYIRYADEHHEGDMQQTYLRVSAILPEDKFKDLNWRLYFRTTKEFLEERQRLLDEKGMIKKEFQNLKGFIRYTDEYHEGKIKKSYQNILAILAEDKVQILTWESYIEKIKKIMEERLRI